MEGPCNKVVIIFKCLVTVDQNKMNLRLEVIKQDIHTSIKNRILCMHLGNYILSRRIANIFSLTRIFHRCDETFRIFSDIFFGRGNYFWYRFV